MRRLNTPLVLLLGILTAGCVSKSEMEAVKGQLDTCERDKVAAQTSSRECESRCETESKRWSNIEAQLTSTLPQTLKDFQDERAKIIQLVPEEVKKQVGGRLDRYFIQVSREFDKMGGKIEALTGELAASRGTIAELAAATRTVDTKIEATHKAVLTEKSTLDDRNRKVAELVALITDFDRDRINCDKCKDRIKVKGTQRESLLAFHAQLIQEVQRLQTNQSAN